MRIFSTRSLVIRIFKLTSRILGYVSFGNKYNLIGRFVKILKAGVNSKQLKLNQKKNKKQNSFDRNSPTFLFSLVNYLSKRFTRPNIYKPSRARDIATTNRRTSLKLKKKKKQIFNRKV